jgi:hypothetical protein
MWLKTKIDSHLLRNQNKNTSFLKEKYITFEVKKENKAFWPQITRSTERVNSRNTYKRVCGFSTHKTEMCNCFGENFNLVLVVYYRSEWPRV